MKGIALLVILLLLIGLGGYLYLEQRPHDVYGTATDEDTGQPVAGVRVKWTEQTVATDTAGRYTLRQVPPGTLLSTSAPGYLPATGIAVAGAILDVTWPTNLTMRPIPLDGLVTDPNGSPIISATITVNDRTGTSDAKGHFSFRRIPWGSQLSVSADGFLPAAASFQEGQPVLVVLEATTVAGTVVDKAGEVPMAGVLVMAVGRGTTTDSAGAYVLRQVPRGAAVTVQADGYLSATYAFVQGESKRVVLSPNTLTGVISDAETKAPVAGATVQEGDRTAQTDAQGRYTLAKVKRAAVLQVSADGFATARSGAQGKATLDVALQPNLIQGTVRDAASGQPIAKATISLDGRTTQTDAQGHYAMRRVKRGQTVVAVAEGYAPTSAQIGDGETLDLALRVGRIAGIVRNAVTGKPISGVTLSVDGEIVTTGADGAYLFPSAPPGTVLTAKYPGYRLARITLGSAPVSDIAMQPFIAKGIYFPFGTTLGAGGQRARDLMDAGVRVGLNTVVIDVKGDIRDDVGRLIYKSDNKLAQRIGASRSNSTEILALLKYAKDRSIYTIARIMAFKDDLLARGAPEMAIKNRYNGGLWIDSGGSYWTDPYNPQVWAYNIALAKECAALGFDEVQFDYIRTATDGDVGAIYYPSKAADDARTRYQIIEGLVAQLPRALPNIYVSLDTFGWTAWREDDSGVGQRIVELAKYVDYISPMVYPSTFGPGSLDFSQPAAHPYEIVYRSSANAAKRVAGLRAEIRPWIQDFDDYTFGIPYNAWEVSLQLKGAEDAGVYGWLIWNPAGVYEQAAWKR